ncbi:MAG: S-layer homology domain-containing protein [Clostridia bacterium]|nr:S-layer homology domain-containing protein [Clostridia bacterium]
MKKIISIILTAAMLTVPSVMPASARTWIKVSSWAYNDVSNFKKEGLIPSMMDDVEDYTQNVTRQQFAELLFRTLVKAKRENDYEVKPENSYYEDVASAAMNEFASNRVIEGETEGEDEHGMPLRYFRPDRLLTREEAAAIMRRASAYYCEYALKNDLTRFNEPSDFSDVSDWAKEDVRIMLSSGLMLGMDNGRFMPKGNITIEQAISLIYRFYNNLPSAPAPDGAEIINGNDTLVQEYTNGIRETKTGNILNLKRGSDTLMEFETDIYTNIHCATNNGTIYAAAQNVNDKTDVYNAQTKELLFKIPYTIHKVTTDYIYTQSSNIGPMTFGMYDYSGNELLEPKYSLEELDILIANNFRAPAEEYTASDGWIYYADWKDTGALYKIDTNGENKQKLSSQDCFNIEYINGWLWYSVRGENENKLFCVREDGKYEQQIGKRESNILSTNYMLTAAENAEVWDENEAVLQVWWIDNEAVFTDDGWVYFVERQNDAENGIERSYGNIKRVRMGDDGTAQIEQISDVIVDYSEYGYSNCQSIQYSNGRLYFMDYQEQQKERKDKKLWNTDLYVFDGSNVTKINKDTTFSDFAFLEDGSLVMQHQGEDEAKWYIADPDGENMREWEEGMAELNRQLEEAGKTTPQPERTDGEIWTQEYTYDDLNDDKFTVSEMNTYKWEVYNRDGEEHSSQERISTDLYATDSAGNKTCIEKDSMLYSLRRIGDVLYYNVGETYLSSSLVSYDMVSGERKVIANDVDYAFHEEYMGEDWFVYFDKSRNLWRYDIKSGKSYDVLPNDSIKKYGKTLSIFYNTTYSGKLYKISEGGRFTLIDDAVHYWTFVPNGEKTGTTRYGDKQDRKQLSIGYLWQVF